MPKYINADEMIIDENEAYLKAQAKPKEYADFLVNQVVHLKLQMLLADAPAADVQEVRHGKWIDEPSVKIDAKRKRTVPIMIYKCSLCNTSNGRIKNAPYCPNCGARMDEEVLPTQMSGAERSENDIRGSN